MYRFVVFLAKIFGFFPFGLKIFIYDSLKPFSGAIVFGLRFALCKSLFKKMGDKVIIGSNVTFKNYKGIEIGNEVSFHENCYLDGYGGIQIKNNISIAHNSTILSSTHTWQDKTENIRDNELVKTPVVICSNVWIGCGVRILGDVIINERSIIAANAVVNRDIASNSVYAGVPAKKIKEI